MVRFLKFLKKIILVMYRFIFFFFSTFYKYPIFFFKCWPFLYNVWLFKCNLAKIFNRFFFKLKLRNFFFCDWFIIRSFSLVKPLVMRTFGSVFFLDVDSLRPMTFHAFSLFYFSGVLVFYFMGYLLDLYWVIWWYSLQTTFDVEMVNDTLLNMMSFSIIFSCIPFMLFVGRLFYFMHSSNSRGTLSFRGFYIHFLVFAYYGLVFFCIVIFTYSYVLDYLIGLNAETRYPVDLYPNTISVRLFWSLFSLPYVVIFFNVVSTVYSSDVEAAGSQWSFRGFFWYLLAFAYFVASLLLLFIVGLFPLIVVHWLKLSQQDVFTFLSFNTLAFLFVAQYGPVVYLLSRTGYSIALLRSGKPWCKVEFFLYFVTWFYFGMWWLVFAIWVVYSFEIEIPPWILHYTVFEDDMVFPIIFLISKRDKFRLLILVLIVLSDCFCYKVYSSTWYRQHPYWKRQIKGLKNKDYIDPVDPF